MVTWRIRSTAAAWRHGCVASVVALLAQSARLPAQSPMPDSVRQYVSAAMTAFRTHSVHRVEVNVQQREAPRVRQCAIER